MTVKLKKTGQFPTLYSPIFGAILKISGVFLFLEGGQKPGFVTPLAKKCNPIL